MNGDFLGGGQMWPIGTSFPCPFPAAGAGGEPQQKAVTTASKTRGERGWKCSMLPCYYECWELIHASSSFFLRNLCVMPSCFATVGFKLFKVFLINEDPQRKKAVFVQGNRTARRFSCEPRFS